MAKLEALERRGFVLTISHKGKSERNRIVGLALAQGVLSPILMVLGEQYPSGERGRVESDASIRVDLKNLEITRPPGAAWMQAVVLRDQSIPLHITLRKETCKDFAALNDFEGKLFAAKSTLEQGLPDQGDQPPGPDEVARAHREAVRSRHAPKTDEKKQAARPAVPSALRSSKAGSNLGSGKAVHDLQAVFGATETVQTARFYGRDGSGFFGASKTSGSRQAAAARDARSDAEWKAMRDAERGRPSPGAGSKGESIVERAIHGAPSSVAVGPRAGAAAGKRGAALAAAVGPSKVQRVSASPASSAGLQLQLELGGGRRPAPAQPSASGFKNIGNTCYINAVLSALVGLPPFVADVLRQWPAFARPLGGNSVCSALHSLLHGATQGEAQPATTRRLKQAIAKRSSQFEGSAQQDAHEFLSDCIDALQEEMAAVVKAPPPPAAPATPAAGGGTPADEITPLLDSTLPDESGLPCALNFTTRVRHTLTCTGCGHSWCREELLRHISLDIPPAGGGGAGATPGRGGGGGPSGTDPALLAFTAAVGGKPVGGPPDLHAALSAFFADDLVEVACEQCGGREARVAHAISSLPRVLTLHLKRFEMTPGGSVRNASAKSAKWISSFGEVDFWP